MGTDTVQCGPLNEEKTNFDHRVILKRWLVTKVKERLLITRLSMLLLIKKNDHM